MLAAIRPGSVNLPLFLHVLGAMLLVGTLLAVGIVIVLGWRRPERASGLTRFALRTVLLGVLPAYVLMRVGAQWTESEQNYPDGYDPAWLGIGYITADAGALLIIVSAVLAALGLRRLRRGPSARFGQAVGVISVVLLAAYLVTVWAMSAKPT